MQAAIVILAAGGSSRLGRPKQLLSYRGRTLLEHACETARAAGPALIRVVIGSHSEELLPLVPNYSEAIVNSEWKTGMASSIRVGIEALPAGIEVAALMLVDQPLLNPDHIGGLLRLVSEDRPVAATRYPDGRSGVPAAFHRSLFPDLVALEGDSGARQFLLCRQDLKTVPATDLLDIDTWADYESLAADR
jgi:molybdenum cofactor cytidylyltransferase